MLTFIECFYTNADGESPDSKDREKDASKSGGQKVIGKRHTFKGIAKVVQLAVKLSPKSQRKQDNAPSNIAELKVCRSSSGVARVFGARGQGVHFCAPPFHNSAQ
jgi:hypothetical protein